MSKSFKFKERELQVLKNFSTISASMFIDPDKLSVKEKHNSCVAYYKNEATYDFEPFAIYDMPQFLGALSTMKDPTIEVHPSYLRITEGSSRFRYPTAIPEIVERAPKVEEKFSKAKLSAEFDLSAEKLNILFKASSVMKTKFFYFETDGDKIRITTCNDLAQLSESFDVTIETGIKINSIESPIKIAVSEIKVINGDYTIKINQSITKW